MPTYVDHYKGPRNQELTTPIAFFEKLHTRFDFTMDGAASEDNALLPNFTDLASGNVWRNQRVFCNPPWDRIAEFVEFAPFSELTCFLLPARVNAKWFHRALELGAVPEYFCGKLKFGGCKWNSPVDCLLLIFRKDSDGEAKRG